MRDELEELAALADISLSGDEIDWRARIDAAPEERRDALRMLRRLLRFAPKDRRFDETDSDSTPWGRYQLQMLAGRGSWGEVFRSWDPELQREVAIKLVKRGGRAALDEGRALARIRHPSIVVVYSVEQHRDRAGVVMEWIDGETLAQRIERDGPLPGHELFRLEQALSSALSLLHRSGLLHRDIKAENVMIDRDGRIVLMDFGVAAERFGTAPPAGTERYFSPELKRGEPASVESDRFALQLLLQLARTGSLPD